MMSEAMQRRYTMIMCLRCSNDLVTLHETEIAFHLRISDAELVETKALFISKGFIDDKWNLLNWDKRQFKSDSSAPRVAKHRANKKAASNADVTLPQRQSNALDTDTDTDKEPSSPDKPDDGFAEFWKAYPRKVGKGAAQRAWNKIKSKADTLQAILKAIAWQRTADQWTKNGGQFIPHPSTWLNEQRWLDEAPAQVAAPIQIDRAAYEAKKKAEMAIAREAYKRDQAESMIPVRAAK
jgi:hypothetical protein